MIKKYLENREFNKKKKEMKRFQEIQMEFLKDATRGLKINHSLNISDDRTIEIINDLQALFGYVDGASSILESMIYLDSDEKKLIKAMLHEGGTHYQLLELIESMQEDAQLFVQEFEEDE